MTHSKLSPYDFIQNAFCPHIAVLSSPLAEQTCQKGNLSFIEMVQPFCRLTSEVHLRDPSGSSVNVKNLRIVMLDVNSRPPQTTLARKFLNESVSSANVDQVTTHKCGDKNIEIPSTVPWFESWRETFLQVQFPADHEFTKHYLACVVVLSTAEPVPLEAARSLSLQLQHLQAVAPGRLPKWFAAPSPPLTCYLLLHDASEGDTAKAEAALAAIKEEFGASCCFLLTVNSRPPGDREDVGLLPDPWSQFLNKHIEPQDGVDSDYSSPRTPADIGVSLSGLTSSVTGDPNLEMGQEISEGGVISPPVPVVLHPLSPHADHPTSGPLAEEPHLPPVPANHLDGSPCDPHINSNVWAGASNTAAAQQPHGTSLTAADLDRIRAFVTELCSRALVPHIERQIQYLNDQISNKKGVSRSLLSATKRWFGPNKPGSPRSTSPNNAVIYAGDAPELQLRRLADLCFMFRHYPLAYQAYHSAKRDFAADGAWLHYAGALEMAALSSFMTGEFNRKTQDYHEEAIITYLNTCRMPQFATRSTLLSVVCLKSRNLYSDAARQLIRMTSEDSDLRSALLLEEAAYCFLQASRPGLLRKYAFHMVLAGHRFSKSGQRKHSLRCYQQAYQVYKGKGWSLAEDHIHFTIGRQAGSLGQRALATKALSRLVAPGSKQVPAQQAYHLREYLVMQQQLSAETAPTELPLLPLPQVTSSLVQLLTGSPPPNPKTSDVIDASGISFEEESKESSSVWLSLEEQLLTESLGNSPVVFKPLLTLFNRFTDNSRQPLTVLKEPVWVCVTVNNPLGVQLPLQNVRLLWTFQPDNSEDTIDSELVDVVESERWVCTQVLADLVLQPNASEKVTLSLTPQGVGQLKVKGLAYRLTNPTALVEPNIPQTATTPICVEGKQIFILEPKKVPRPGKDRSTGDKAQDDLRFQPKVLPAAPLLQASFSTLPSELISGEIQRVTMTLVNCGSHPLKTLLLGSDTPNLFALDRAHPTGTVAKSRQNVVRLSLESGVLEAGAKIVLNLWIRTPDQCGKTKLKLLFFYESAIPGSALKYRLLRHCWDLCILDSLQLTVTPRRSTAFHQQGGLNITARVTNTNRVQDLVVVKVNLLQVSMSSSLWELSNLPVEPAESDVCLGPQECAHLLFRARTVSSKTAVLSDLALSPKVKDLVPLSDSPHYDFLLRHSWTAAGIQPKVGPQPPQPPQPPEPAETPQPTTAASAEAALRVDATFVVRWEAKVTDAAHTVRQAFGQHHVTLVKLSDSVSCPVGPRVGRPRSGEVAPSALRVFGPDRNVPSESDTSAEQVPSQEALQRLVTFYLQHSPKVTHNFDVQRLCFVQVHLFLRNCCKSLLRVEVNLSGGQSSLTSRSQLYVPHASSVVRWVGQIVSHFELAPNGTHSLALCAAITAPGTYDLGALLTVSCKFAEEPNAKDTVQDTRVHSAVVVSHSDGIIEQQIQQLSHGMTNMALKDISVPS